MMNRGCTTRLETLFILSDPGLSNQPPPQPRFISDFSNPGNSPSDFSGRVGSPLIDDEVTRFNNGFGRVTSKRPPQSTVTSIATTPPSRVNIRINRVRPGSDEGAFTKIVANPTQPSFPQTPAPTTPTTISSISTIQDFLQTSGGVPTLELSKIKPTSPTRPAVSRPLSILEEKPDTRDKKPSLTGTVE